MWYLYIVRCARGSLYTGITTDVQRRFEEHASQGRRSARYLRGRAPLELLYSTEVGNKRRALRAERAVKGLARKRKHLLIAGDLSLEEIGISP